MRSGHLGWDATLKRVHFDNSAQMQRAFILEDKDERMRSLIGGNALKLTTLTWINPLKHNKLTSLITDYIFVHV